MASGKVIAAGFILLVVCLLGLAAVRWAHRRYAVLLVFSGIVLAVGLHPIGDSAPLIKPLDTLGLSLALRSSTRAIPLSTFGLALGAGALVGAAGALRWRWRALIPIGVAVLAILNLPSLWHRSFVDPALTRDQDPPAARDQAAGARRRRPRRPRAGTARPGVRRVPLGLHGGPHRSPASPTSRWRHGTCSRSAALGRWICCTPSTTGSRRPRSSRRRSPRSPASSASDTICADQRRGVRTVPHGPTRAGRGDVRRRRAGHRAGDVVRHARPNVPAVPMVDEAALSLPSVGEPLPPVQLVDVQDGTRDGARRRPTGRAVGQRRRHRRRRPPPAC